MRIKKLHLQNFRGFENLEMTFPETSNLVVLIGKNGSGKSSVLDAVAGSLQNIVIIGLNIEIQKDISPIFNKYDIKKGKKPNDFKIETSCSYNTIDEEKREETMPDMEYELKTKYANFGIDYVFDSSSFSKLNGYLIFPKIRPRHPNEDHNTKMVLDNQEAEHFYKHLAGFFYGSEYYNPVFFAHYNTKSRLDLFEQMIEQKSKNLKYYYDYDYKYDNLEVTSNYSGIFGISSLTDFKIFQAWFMEQSDIENRIKSDKEDFKYQYFPLEVLRLAMERFFKIITSGDFKKLKMKQEIISIDKAEVWLEIQKGDTSFKLEELSNGEKMIITLIVDITKRILQANYRPNQEKTVEEILNGNGIVLIDEIDQHLHPEWQRNILPALAKTFPNVQFIVTTHSPQVLSSIPKEGVFLIKDGKAYANGLHTQGRDSNSLLQEAFGIPKHNKELSAKLTAFYGFLDTKNQKQAQDLLDELTELWGENDVEIVRANLYFQDLLDEINDEAH